MKIINRFSKDSPGAGILKIEKNWVGGQADVGVASLARSPALKLGAKSQ